MSVLLTTAFDPGDLDPGKTYPRANIVFQSIRPEEGQYHEPPGITVQYTFGNTVNGVWVKGDAAPDKIVHITGTDYEALLEEVTTSGEDHLIYAGAKRVLYEYLIAKNLLAGTIE